VPAVAKQAQVESNLQSQGQPYELVQRPVSAASIGLLAIAMLSEGVNPEPIQANYLREPDATQAKPKKVSG
jgi:hypothetical protein